MGQEDYLIREIEKLGVVLRAILSQFMGNSENLAITLEKQFEESNEMLLREINFDLDKFLLMNSATSGEYISRYKGLSPANLELLADILFQMGFKGKPEDKRIYQEKSLQLYEFCDMHDKTYSFDRENKINRIKSSLQTG